MISIIIPCYNDHDVLPYAVRSVLRQQYDDIEIIIVDDGSDVPIKNSFGSDKVRVIRHRKNKGLPEALNTGVRVSNGDRFVILAADDELHKEYLLRMTAYDADIVSCDLLVGGKPVRAKAGDLETLVQYNCHSYAALIKKWVWGATSGFKAAMNPSWEDWEFFLNAAKVGAKWQHIPFPGHIYHRSSDGRDANAQGKETLLWGKLQGYHQDLYGMGRGVVSFIVPCYGHEEFVANAVRSALDQEYPHVNVVVVDDGSPGDVEKALREVSDNRVTLLRQPNGHLSSARNTGIYYALQTFDSEYLVMLDADDEVHPAFIEHTMGLMYGKEYIYTDVKFIGDAYHTLPMEEFNCMELPKKHIHPCTFLMQSNQWRDVAKRGYGYDENMKSGYEDWEFTLASVYEGWCGRRLPEPLFYYRYHKNGSMRTEAKKIASKLVSYIRKQHSWTKDRERLKIMCKSCGGGGRFTRSKIIGGGSVFVKGVGDVNPTDMLEVTYTGSTTSVMTKVGAGNQIYKYSGDPEKQQRGHGPKFVIYARDVHLFVGPFKIRRLEQVQQPQVASYSQVTKQAGDSIVESSQSVTRPEPRVVPIRSEEKKLTEEVVEELLDEQPEKGVDLAPEDFTVLKNVGSSGQRKLEKAGFAVYEDILDSNSIELAQVLGMSKERAEEVIASAREIIASFEEE